jgi:hypothetical protein
MAPHADRAEEQEGLAWPEEGSGRDAVQQAVLARAAAARGHPEPVVVPDDEHLGEPRFGGVGSGDTLRRMAGLGLPEARGRASLVKLIVRKLTAWELDPVIHHVNTVHKATLDALDDLRGGDGAGGSDQRGRTATSRTKVPPGK